MYHDIYLDNRFQFNLYNEPTLNKLQNSPNSTKIMLLQKFSSQTQFELCQDFAMYTHMDTY